MDLDDLVAELQKDIDGLVTEQHERRWPNAPLTGSASRDGEKVTVMMQASGADICASTSATHLNSMRSKIQFLRSAWNMVNHILSERNRCWTTADD